MSIRSFCSILWPFLLLLVELALWPWPFDCLLIPVTLSLPPCWVRLVTMSIPSFVHSCDPFSSSWLSCACANEHSIVTFAHSCDPFSSSWLSLACDDEHLIVCSFLRPFLFPLVELGLCRWAFDRLFIRVTPSLPPDWVTLVSMNIPLFAHSCDPFTSSWLSLACDDEH